MTEPSMQGEHREPTSEPGRPHSSGSGGHEAPAPSPPPSRGPRVWVVLAVVAAAVLLFALGGSWGQQVTDRLGSLLRSLPFLQEKGPEGEPSGGYYTCGMHPWVILPKPGLCPICHMDLTPLDPAKFTGEIAIDPRVVQSMGVRVEEVTTGPLVKTIRTVGSVTYDETRVRDVNIKVKGWIEELHVDYLGAEVREGEPLFDLYSPELYDTQQQYLLAYRNRGKQDVPFLPGAERDPQRLLESSRVRLEYYDITAEQIAELEQRGEPQKTLTIVSPHTGVVISKHANEGMLVEPGMRVFRIADLSKVWVLVTLYEYQLPYVSEGQRAVMTLPYIPGERFEGNVVYVYPFLESRTREVQLRIELDNPDRLLKPGMFASVQLKSTLAQERILAPRAAVIDTGERQVAFVSLGDGRFEPRDVRMGVLTDQDRVQILEGLRPGELVVTSAQFLLDSEARIREALGKMITGNLASEQRAAGAVAGASELSELPEPAAEALSRILDAYFAIGETMASDSAGALAEPSRDIAAAVDRMLEVELPEAPHFWHEHPEAATVRGEALELAAESDLAEARLKYADLSVALSSLVKATGVPPEYGKTVEELHCPMYREDQGGTIWLQPEGDVRNPFYGSTMLRCFDTRMVLPVTGGRNADTVAPSGESPEEPDAAGRPEGES